MSTIKRFNSLLICALLGLPSSVFAQTIDKQVLSLEGAKIIAAAAEAVAASNKWNVVIAIVDDGGHLIFLQRMDNAPTGSVRVAQGKARTSAAFKRPSGVFDKMASARPAITSIPDVVLLEGGVPVVLDGRVVGAVGVSGASSEQDAQMAEAGISALKK
jgi:glc operon protein GlcG